jgi:hypothetical protein
MIVQSGNSGFSMKTLNQMIAAGRCVAVLAAIAAAPPGLNAQTPITLTDGNTTAIVDPYSSAGMKYWSVNGQNQLNQQWFWYRIDGGAQQSIDTIGAPTLVTNANTLTTTYANPNLSVAITYTLNGGGMAVPGTPIFRKG